MPAPEFEAMCKSTFHRPGTLGHPSVFGIGAVAMDNGPLSNILAPGTLALIGGVGVFIFLFL
jgi:hypothetical protein